MIWPIEYNGKPVEFNGCEEVVAAFTKAEDGSLAQIPDNAALTVCAWCVPPIEQQPLKDAGFTLSHGICAHCLERQRGKEAV